MLTIVYGFRLLMFIFDLSSGLGPMDPGPVSSDVLHSGTSFRSYRLELGIILFVLYLNITLCLFNMLVVF